MALIPRPNGPVVRLEGRFRLPEALVAAPGDFEPRCLDALRERTGLREAEQGPPWLFLVQDRALPSEGCRLTVTPDRVTAEAAEERGILWALTTFFALLRPDGTAPCCQLEDRPRFPHRGLCLDCARRFFPLPVLKGLVEEMALAKLNVFHWHLTDDQAWRLESALVPGRGEARYTREEVRTLVDFAQARGVEVIPEIDLPGHVSALLAARPELACAGRRAGAGTGGGIYDAVLCAGQEETYDFLEKLLEEVCGLFPGPCLHIGGDEVRDCWWKTCPRCRERMEREGLRTPAELQGYFTRRVSALVRELGRTPVCWSDALRGGLLPEETVVQSWTPRHPLGAARSGPWVYSDLFHLYLDYPHALLPLERVYRCVPADPVGDLLGLEACLWTERVEDGEALRARLFPRLLALAEAAWTERRDYGDFLRRLRPRPGWTPPADWDPRGAEARREAGEYLRTFRRENGTPDWPGFPMAWRFLTHFGSRSVL